ncbi:MAG TPA: glycosyl hydrolase family 18 protein [Pseudonocardiaceae bacterium]|nr:glycosyl hydrolase family 18 protein [Pseudonocardiaceae bacterium]
MDELRINRWLAGLSLAVVTCVGGALLAATTAAAATNLITNGDFEAGSASGWTCSSAAVVGSPVHGGTHALELTPTSSDDAQCTQTVSVQPNSAYTLTDWVEGSFVFLGATGTGTTDPSTFTQAASSFTQLSVSFTTGASTTSVSVFVHGWFAQPADTVDDIVLTGPAGSGTTPPPTGPTVPSAPAGLHTTATTSSSVSLAWTAASGATSYNVYRNGTKVGSATSTSFTDTGLSASTTFSYAVTAVNTAGESATSTAVSATTAAGTTPPPTGGSAGLPAHILTGYWQDFVNGATVMRLSAVPTTYDLVAVAFANATTTPGAVTYSVDSGLSSALGGYTDADFTADIATLHSRGQKVIISVGGQNGTISVADSTSATNFANSINGLISKFGFDGVDIDLENGVNPTFMSQALHSIAAAHPGVIITLAPQTIDMQSTGMAYFQLALNIQSILTIVNMQYYNSGTMNGCDGNVYAEGTENFLTALACIQLQGGLSPSQIGLGLPASASAAGGGLVSPGTVNSAMDCLDMGTNCGTFHPATTAPGLRGAMTWSINWDASNGFAFANTVHPHLASLH